MLARLAVVKNEFIRDVRHHLGVMAAPKLLPLLPATGLGTMTRNVSGAVLLGDRQL